MISDLKAQLSAEAERLGFDALRVTRPDAVGTAGERLRAYLEAGRHGDMDWMQTHADRRADPHALMPEVRSVIMLGMSYAPGRDPLEALQETSHGVISAYAKGRDYHDVLKSKLKVLAALLQAKSGADVRVFVDTAPLMEKPLAAAAGIGWQGKHTNLVSRTPWLVAVSRRHPDECRVGARSSRKSITAAAAGGASTFARRPHFPAPYQLDARRCIAYLTIEHKGHIAREFREAMGNRVFGCDDCLAVCPWNKFAAASREMRFAARGETDDPPLAELLALDDPAFRSAVCRNAGQAHGA